MGADVSAPQNYQHSSNELKDLAQKYRERFGHDIPNDVVEQYRIAKLKSDMKTRQEQAQGEDDNSTSHENHPHEDVPSPRDGDEYYVRKKQEQNLRIMQKNYDISRREKKEDRRHRSNKDRRDDDQYERRSRRPHSSRVRSHSRRSSSDSSTKENRRNRHSSRKSQSSEHREEKSSSRQSRSTEDKMKKRSSRDYQDEKTSSTKHRNHFSSRRSSSDSSKNENGRQNHSSRKSQSLETREEKPSKQSRSTKDKTKKKSSDSHYDEKYSSTSRHSRSEKPRERSHSEEDGRHAKKRSNKENSGRPKKERASLDDSAIKSRSKKKKKSDKASRYQSAPDLTENDRQYGKGPWQRTHSYFDDYGQQPQSWVRELSHERSGVLPAPVMERQIIYGIPPTIPAVDGLGYPLKERSPGFQPVPYQTYLLHKPTQPRSMDLSYQSIQGNPSLGPMSSPVSNTTLKLPFGCVPAFGPAAISPTGPHAAVTRTGPSMIIDSHPIIPERGYEVQARLPSNMSSTLPSKFRKASNEYAPNYKTPPQYGASLSGRSNAPTPMPRTKTPTRIEVKNKKSKKERSAKETHSSEHKKKKSKITATSARVELESMLAFDYDMSKVKDHGDFTEEFPSDFPETYRANEAIFVDDVVFRNHPKIPDLESDSDSSDMITDEEHVLTLGAEMSPTSPSYSSGFDLEIPEGFCFDSEGMEMSPDRNKKNRNKTKLLKASKTSQENRTTATNQNKKKIAKSSALNLHATPQTTQRKEQKSTANPLVLTTIEPVSRHAKKSASSEKDPKSLKRKTKEKATSPNTKVNTEREKIIYPSKVVEQNQTQTVKKEKRKGKNKRVQHPSKNDDYLKIIIPSQNWVSKPEPKKMHDVGVGTKPRHKQKTIGVQTLKTKEPKAQPIYFLKPISSQEVFIDESSIASRSEMDMSQGNTVNSSNTSTGSATARSGLSWSRSSTYSSNTDPSEVESVRQNFQRNSRLYSSNHKEKHQIDHSVTSTDFESEQQASIGPASMTLGVSESIQASSYTGRGGKVFCITKSKHGSSQSTIISEEKPRSVHQHSVENHVQQNIEPVTHKQLEKVEQNIPQGNSAQANATQNLNPHEVGQWVLNCYSQDQKLTTHGGQIQSGNVIPIQNLEHRNVPPKINHGNLTKQHAIDSDRMMQSISVESHSQDDMPQVTPLTTEALSRHEENSPWPRNRVGYTSTEHSTDIVSDIGVFQKELMKARHKIHEIQRSRSSENTTNAEQYKVHLKQWNDSPTSNVVLAECCEVTDDDISDHKIFKSNPPHFSRSGPVEVPQNINTGNSVTTENSDSDESTSSESSGEYTNPQVKLKKSFEQQNHHEMLDQQKPQNDELSKEASMQKINNFLEDLEKNSDVKSQTTYRKMSAESRHSQNDDWRRVGVPRYPPPPMDHPAKDVNDYISQKDPIVPGSIMRPRKSNDNNFKKDSVIDAPSSGNNLDPPVLEPLRLRTSSLATESDVTTCSSPIANPFNKMDNDEIESLVGKIPGRGSKDNPDLEKDVMAELDKSRQAAKRESLEERTARILGIHRKVSTESDDSQRENQTQSQHPVEKDMSTYMNDLLTGVTEVSPATRHRYFASEKSNKNLKSQVTSPLASNIASNVNTNYEKEQNISEFSGSDTSSNGTDDETITESFSVNVSDSVMEANIECKVRIEQNNNGYQQSPTEYMIPDNMENRTNGPVSPSRGMMLSYGSNIYAETPGFHKQQESSDSSEDDEQDLPQLPNKSSAENQNVDKRELPRRILDSPVPIAINSPPLTDGEIDILRELVKNGSRTTSHASVDDMSSNGEKSRLENLPVQHDRSSPESQGSSTTENSWSSSRESARKKIAESIGFTLPVHSSKSPINSDEYDIKILSRDRNRDSSNNTEDNTMTRDDKKEVENAMESLGLNPSETWLLSV